MNNSLIDHITPEQQAIIKSLNSPVAIQAYLDQIPYSTEDANRSPLQVILDQVAHCLDGALFAAAALREIGFPPMLIDMFPDPGRDDDHVLAVFKIHGCFGALAKSNFPGLRMREPIYRTTRELVISYFEDYFNQDGEKTLRTYTRILHLEQFDSSGWSWNSAGVDTIEKKLLSMKRTPLITADMAARLSPVDSLTYQSGMVGVNPAGLYKLGNNLKP